MIVDSSSWVPFLFVLSLAGMCVSVFLLRKGRRRETTVVEDALARDREQLERLEAIDQRLERLEKTLHDMPS